MAKEYVERETEIAEINKRSQYICDNDFGVIIRVENVINAIPSADVAPVVRGNWTIYGKCSVCGEEPLTEFDVELMNFCPNCGARMSK